MIVYPNPAKNQVAISGLSGNETIELRDMTGRIIRTVTNSLDQTTQSIWIDQLSNGVYNLRISTESGQVVASKLIKQ